MAQQARFHETFAIQTTGLPHASKSVTVYREGATVNGNQSGTSPLTITVRDKGKIAAADTVFVNADTGTTHTVDSVTDTTVVVSGFAGTLVVVDKDRLVPSNSLPTLYSDDHAGASTANPLTTSAAGLAQAWIAVGAYDHILSGSGVTTTLFQGIVHHREVIDTNLNILGVRTKSEPLFNVKHSTYGAIGDGTTDDATAIQAAIDAAEAAGGGTVFFPQGTYLTTASLVINSPNVRLLGVGSVDRSSSGQTYVSIIDIDVNDSGIKIENKTTSMENLTIRAKSAGSSTIGILVDNGSAGTTVYRVWLKNVAVADFASHGIKVVEGEQVVIEDCIVRDCAGRGITMEGTSGVGITCTIRNTRVKGSGASESVHIFQMIGTVLENLQVLDGAASSVLLNIEGCSEMLIINADVERPSTATGIKVAKGAGTTIIGGNGGVLSSFIDVSGTSGNHSKGLTIIGARASSNSATGLTINANVERVTLLALDMNATTPFSIVGGYDEEATGTFTLSSSGTTDINSNAGAITGTLGNGHIPGDIKTIIMTDAGSSSTVSVTNHETSDPEVITFAAVDDTWVGMWTGTEWITIKLSGATV